MEEIFELLDAAQNTLAERVPIISEIGFAVWPLFVPLLAVQYFVISPIAEFFANLF